MIPRLRISTRLFGCGALVFGALALAVSGLSGAMTDASFGTFPVGKFIINNNTWGEQYSPGGHESTWSTGNARSTGPVTWGAKYDWPVGDNPHQVKAYPSIFAGWQFGIWSRDSGLPARIADLRAVTTSGSIAITNPGVQNVAYDCWFHAIPNPGNKDRPTDELMIWVAHLGGAGPLGKLQGTATIGGTTWEVYKGEIGWNVYSFVRKTNTESWQLDVRDFIRYVVATKHWMAPTKYLTSVQFGSEIFRTDGPASFEVKDYRCDVK